MAGGAGGAGGEAGFCDEYVACGCGCCSGGPAPIERCFYPEAGDSLASIIAQDQTQQSSPSCATAGCSVGVRHRCCVSSPPEPAGSATYTAHYTSTALDRMIIQRMSPDGRCARLVFASPHSGVGIYTALELPAGSWALEQIHEMPCAMSALPPPGIGAFGQLHLVPQASGCAVSIHLTAFFAHTSVRFDAEGLALAGVSPGACQ
jgi:hypothetical protein